MNTGTYAQERKRLPEGVLADYRTVVIVTTLLDPQAQVYSKEAIAELYGYRWQVEIDLLPLLKPFHCLPFSLSKRH